jgi:hypothetical protein
MGIFLAFGRRASTLEAVRRREESDMVLISGYIVSTIILLRAIKSSGDSSLASTEE